MPRPMTALAAAILAVAAVTACSATPAAERTPPPAVANSQSAATTRPVATTESPEPLTFDQIARDAAAIAQVDDHGLCELYGPTQDGDHGPLARQIADLYMSGSVTQRGVETLMERLDAAEAAASPAMVSAVQGMNEPIVNMQRAIDAGSTNFSNTWDASAAALALMQSCVDVGFRR